MGAIRPPPDAFVGVDPTLKETKMDQPGLDHRHRDKNGEISRKHGNTLIGTLRKIYGPGFAMGQPEHATLGDALATLNEHSLSQLVHDHQQGSLAGKLDHHGKTQA
jgi:hypothetical protein